MQCRDLVIKAGSLVVSKGTSRLGGLYIFICMLPKELEVVRGNEGTDLLL